jgi:hypothetical protein
MPMAGPKLIQPFRWQHLQTCLRRQARALCTPPAAASVNAGRRTEHLQEA